MNKIFLLSMIFIAGCSVSEVSRVAGIGVNRFKVAGEVYSKDFSGNISDTYKKITEALDLMGAKIYRGSLKKGYVVVVGFDEAFSNRCIDSTEVVVFYSEIDANNTKVEVSSLNFSLSEFVSSRLFESL